MFCSSTSCCGLGVGKTIVTRGNNAFATDEVGLVKGDSSVFVLSWTGHFGYSSIHNSVNIIGRTFILHLHGSCHICVSM